jgi:hypothetical protein
MADERRIRADLEIRALKCPDGLPFVEQSLRDPRLPGLKIRVYRGDRKVFFLVYRVNRDKKCLKLGVYNPPQLRSGRRARKPALSSPPSRTAKTQSQS